MVRKIYAHNARFENVRVLKEAIIDAWLHVDKTFIDHLYSSMDNRIFELIRKNGAAIDYWNDDIKFVVHLLFSESIRLVAVYLWDIVIVRNFQKIKKAEVALES